MPAIRHGPIGPDTQAESRARLLDSPVGRVENVSRDGARLGKGPESFSPDFQIGLPYRGLFVWHVGDDDVVGDPNQVLFVRGGESYRMSAPLDHGCAELITMPNFGALSEIAHGNRTPLLDHPLFQQRA